MKRGKFRPHDVSWLGLPGERTAARSRAKNSTGDAGSVERFSMKGKFTVKQAW